MAEITVGAGRPVGANLSTCVTVQPARIDFDQVNLSELSESEKRFVGDVTKHKQVVYDWGHGIFFSCSERCVVDHSAQTITPDPKMATFTGIWQDDLKTIVGDAWKGDWGPSAVDAILVMLNSGVEVELVNTKVWGPEDPVGFMDSLRRMLVSGDTKVK